MAAKRRRIEVGVKTRRALGRDCRGSFSFAKRLSKGRPISPRSRRLLLEPLEERTLLALAPVLVDLQPGSDSGLYDDDNLTNVSTPIIDITAAEPDDIINVYREGALLGQATQVSGTSYQYEFTPDQLIEGVNSITARSFDGIEESGDSPPAAITLDVTGLRITASTPDTPFNLRTDLLDSITITFSEEIDFDPAGGGSFAVEDSSITGPESDIAPVGIVSQGGNEYAITFTAETERGKYAVSVGPDIADLAGNLMDQDEDGLLGEAEEDVFILSFHAFDADAVFTAPTTISEGDTTYDGQDIAIDSTTVAIDGPHSFNTVYLLGSAVLTHSANTATETHRLDLTVTEEIIIDSTSVIDVSGKGYLAGRTTGNTTEGGATGRSGGSYGGVGGSYEGQTNTVYGDYANPDDWGSGGGGGSGGGLIRITADMVLLDGQILAGGGASAHYGGGSGGGIFLSSATLQGSGTIEAPGGWGGSDTYFRRGRGGGGGRIAVHAQDYSGFELDSITAVGGTANNRYAGAGTVYVRDTDETYGTLIIFGGRGTTPLDLSGGSAFASVVVRGTETTAELDLAGLSLDVQDAVIVTDSAHLAVDGSLTVGGTVTVSESGSQLKVEGNLTVGDTLVVGSGGMLEVDGPLTTGGLLTIDGATLTGTSIAAPEVSIVNGGTLTTFAANDSKVYRLELSVAGTVLIDSTSKIDVRAGTVEHVDVWFSEEIDAWTFTPSDIAISDPDGQPVDVSGIEEVGFNRFRISFSPQTTVGTYHVEIGPDVRDIAGNPLDQDRDWNFGEEEDDVYDATFNLVDVDLRLANVVVDPTQLWAGQPVSVSFDGTNASGAPLLGEWTDAVYLSADEQWDINDVRLTTVPHTGGLAQDADYHQSVTTELPGKLPGDYYILVRADVYNEEKEGVDESDNVTAFGPLPLAVRPLATDGVPAGGTLRREDRADYYAVEVETGDSVVITLDGHASGGANELYVSFEAVPTRLHYDHKVALGGQDLELGVPGVAGGGTFYVLVYADQIDAPTPYEITVEAAEVILTEISPPRHGNVTPGTLTLTGLGFDENTSVAFVDTDGREWFPTAVHVHSPTVLTVDLDLPNWPADVYDVRISQPGGEGDELIDALTIVEGGLSHLETNLIVPGRIRPGGNITVWVEYQNTGEGPMPSPLLELQSSNGGRFMMDLGLTVDVTDRVQFLATGSGATPGILQPGDSGRIPVYFLNTTRWSDSVTFTLGTLTAADTTSIDWITLADEMRPE